MMDLKKPCRHGIILYGTVCIRCEKRKAAAAKIKALKSYNWKRSGYSDFDIFAKAAAYAAKVVLDSVRNPTFVWNGPKQKIRRQSFFGKDSSLPDIIKVRRLVPYPDFDDVMRDGVQFGMGAVVLTGGTSEVGKRVDPRDIWNVEPPIYTLEDICWNSKL